MEKIVKEYPEFGYSVEYNIIEDLLRSVNDQPAKDIEWIVLDSASGVYLMSGLFKSDNYYRSNFKFPIVGMEENILESLFYIYFENIKLECIELVEGREIEDNDDEM